MIDFDKTIELLENSKATKSDFVIFMAQLDNPYLVLIFCILSLRTNDKTTYPASLRLLELGKTPEEISLRTQEEIEKAIYPVGFYKNKSGQILELSKILVEKYSSKVPDEIDELLKFRGVGRKTANLVLAEGFHKPAICVDVHVHRISNRLGWLKTKNPDETEFELRRILPQKYWMEINSLLITLGQNTCKPTKPLCQSCPIKEFCAYFNANS